MIEKKVPNNNNPKEKNEYFMCTKNGLYIVAIKVERNMVKFEITNADDPTEEEIELEDGPVSCKGYLPEDTVRTAV